MKKQSFKFLIIGILQAIIILMSAWNYYSVGKPRDNTYLTVDNENLKKKAFSILENKCNSCHRRQNPFMIFKEKNMSKRAEKIYKMVFVEGRMPKGNEIKLSESEYKTLKQWLSAENIF